LLAGAVVVEPGAVQTYLAILVNAYSLGHDPSTDLTSSTLSTIIETSAPLGHHHEVVWSLWGILAFRLQAGMAAAQAVSKLENSFVALLALDAERNGLIRAGLDTAKWEARMTSADLYDDQWLLSYEANVKAWLPSIGGADHVTADQRFAFLKRLGIEFYAPVPALVRLAAPVPGLQVYP
jgi:hypothetical protein